MWKIVMKRKSLVPCLETEREAGCLLRLVRPGLAAGVPVVVRIDSVGAGGVVKGDPAEAGTAVSG